MRAMLPTAGEAATNAGPRSGSDCSIKSKSGSDQPFTPTSESDDWDWFAPVAWAVLGKKDPGQDLHYLTGFPLSTCRAYVAKERDGRRAPNPVFLRKLFHSSQGAPFHDAFMHGCTAQWLLDRQRYERMGAAADNAK